MAEEEQARNEEDEMIEAEVSQATTDPAPEYLLSLAIGFLPHLHSLKTFPFLIFTWNIYFIYFILPYFSYLFKLTLVESKRRQLYLKALMDEELFEGYLEDKGIT